MTLRRHRYAALVSVLAASAVLGQTFSTGPGVVSGGSTQTEDSPEWMKRLAIDPEGSVAKQYREQAKKRVTAEKELRKIRAKHFGPIKAQQVRQDGIVKLREHTDPALFPSMVKLFDREGADVRIALLDHYFDSASPEGDAAISWMAVFDRAQEVRDEATARAKKRIKAAGETPIQMKFSTYKGLASRDQDAICSAASFARGIDMIDAIPWLIAKQITGQPGVQQPTTTGASLGQGGTGDLAWIAIGQQTAFVADLEPVVGPYAVAFDPQLGVVTSGVLLRIVDAAVVSYNVDIHNVLTDWTSDLMGQSTRELGWNVPAWQDWYAKTFVPEMQRRAAAKQAEQAAPPK